MVSTMKIGYQTLTWANYYGDYDIKDAIRDIKKIGFEGIELIEPISKLGTSDSLIAALTKKGLKAASLSCNLNMKPNDTSDIDETKKRIQFAKELGIKDMMMCGGWLSGNVEKEDKFYKILAAKLEACCEHAAGFEMNIAFHPHRGTIVETSEDIEKLLQFTNKPKLCIDIAHLAACGSDPIQSIKKFKEIVTYVHLKDWDVELDDFVELGKGDVDITRCLSALKEQGYDGWAVVELDRTRKTPEESACISADYLRKAGLL